MVEGIIENITLEEDNNKKKKTLNKRYGMNTRMTNLWCRKLIRYVNVGVVLRLFQNLLDLKTLSFGKESNANFENDGVTRSSLMKAFFLVQWGRKEKNIS